MKSLEYAIINMGEIVNRGNIGKTSDELVAQWNAEHPEDPVI